MTDFSTGLLCGAGAMLLFWQVCVSTMVALHLQSHNDCDEQDLEEREP